MDAAAVGQFGVTLSAGFLEVTQEPVSPVPREVAALAAASGDRVQKLPFEASQIWQALKAESGRGG